jgi:dynein light chain LC8-type
MSNLKFVVEFSDMKEEMKDFAVACCAKAFDIFRKEVDIARFVRQEFDRKYNLTWHCVIGRNFSVFVSHEVNHFIQVLYGDISIVLFKSG